MSITLHCRKFRTLQHTDGRSAEYSLALCARIDSSYPTATTYCVVSVYGPITSPDRSVHTALESGDWDQAERVYAKTFNEKTGKGYRVVRDNLHPMIKRHQVRFDEPPAATPPATPAKTIALQLVRPRHNAFCFEAAMPPRASATVRGAPSYGA